MTLTLRSKELLRNSSNLRRTSCSGRGNGARNFGLRTILAGSTLGSSEALMTVSCFQNCFSGLRTPAPYGRWNTVMVPLRCRDKHLYRSDLTTLDSVNWPDAHLLTFPILSRNPMDFDTCKLLQKHQRN